MGLAPTLLCRKVKGNCLSKPGGFWAAGSLIHPMRTFVVLGFALLALVIGPARAAGQIADRDLGEKVAEAVRTYSKFSIFDDINIGVDNRNVVLMGKVTAPIKKDDIEKRVAKIDGIRSLRNDIEVLPVSQVDQRLRVLAANAIYNHPSFWRYAELANPPIHIIVEHQRITLTGIVDSQTDKMLAYSLLQFSGVLSVDNKLRVGLGH
jgi:hyperosmotically inducible periplasmic protein